MTTYPIVGIDPGKKGGIACLFSASAWVTLPLPHRKNGDLDVRTIKFKLKHWSPHHIVIEHQWGRAVQGIKTSGVMMYNYGKLRACIELYGPRQLTVVSPKDWQRVMIPDTPSGMTKAASIKYCQDHYPNVNLLPTRRSTKLHDGMADALCLASYVKPLEELENELSDAPF